MEWLELLTNVIFRGKVESRRGKKEVREHVDRGPGTHTGTTKVETKEVYDVTRWFEVVREAK